MSDEWSYAYACLACRDYQAPVHCKAHNCDCTESKLQQTDKKAKCWPGLGDTASGVDESAVAIPSGSH